MFVIAIKYTYDDIFKIAKEKGYTLLSSDIGNYDTKILLLDSDGYKVYATVDKIINRNSKFRRFHKCNDYTISNVNHFAKTKNINSVCISDKYMSSKDKLVFRCSCGNLFSTTLSNFLNLHKVKCDRCTGYNNNLSYSDVKEKLKAKGYFLDIKEGEYRGVTLTELKCIDSEGFKYNVAFHRVMNGKIPDAFNKSNKYTIDNINHYLRKNKIPFDCVSDEYIDNQTPLVFKCRRCGETVSTPWINVYRNDKTNRKHVVCSNCDGSLESIHALVLKQLFKHFYPSTIEEEKSCINPSTGKVMPTDIVNHDLKIAIEIQSQWHDLEDRKEKDLYKKTFWLNKGYEFYSPDIRDYSVLEMCQLFFNIDVLPEWINYNYANKLNIKEMQKLIDDGLTPPEIERKTGINKHRIYDAIYSGKLTRKHNITKIPRDCGGSCGNICAEVISLPIKNRNDNIQSELTQ